jgi:RNA polymerase sigma factor (sigma-70 family)
MTQRAGQPDVHELYELYGRAIYRRCQYFLRTDAEAQDAMHDVFIKVIERWHDFKGESSPLTWMVRIATNHCLNVIRSRRAGWRGRYETTVQVDVADRPEPGSTKLERDQLVRLVLAKVDQETQAAAIYYFVDEMTQEDAAKAAGCSVPTFRKRLRKFIRTARHVLKNTDVSLVFGPEPV